LLQEVEVAAGTTIFLKGEVGRSMYIIVSGRVRVHEGERLLNYLDARSVFGEMALLDPQPRMATATAEEDTLLFQLDQEPFYHLMADQPEVARGIIRVLSSRLRSRAEDVVALQARVEALERRLTGDTETPPQVVD
jgi:CRP/FNR family transcriptional regulator, cyclic AMP receptor protein